MGAIKPKKQERVCLHIIPDGPICNECAYQVAEFAADLYRPLKRLNLSREGIRFSNEDFVTWEVIFTCDSVSYYLTCPERLAEILKIRAETSWQNVRVNYVPLQPSLDEVHSAGVELVYKRKDIFSLNIEDSCQLGSDFNTAMRVLSGKDRVVIQVVFDSIDNVRWQQSAKQSYFGFIRGAVTKISQLDRQDVGGFIGLLSKVVNLLTIIFGRRKYSHESSVQGKPNCITRLFQMRRAVDPSKPSSAVVRVFLRIAAQSRNEARAMGIARVFANAYKKLSADNEFRTCEVKQKRFIKEINSRQLPVIKLNGNIMSIKECGKLMSLQENN